MKNKYCLSVEQLRIKVIGFKDDDCNGIPFEISDFFTLPDDLSKLESFVDTLEVEGRKAESAFSLEALAVAMQSDWYAPPDETARKRHCIVLYTEADSHNLDIYSDSVEKKYPYIMPESYFELVDLWCGQLQPCKQPPVKMDQVAKRLVLLAPESNNPWCDIVEDFDACYTWFIDYPRNNANNDLIDINHRVIEAIKGYEWYIIQMKCYVSYVWINRNKKQKPQLFYCYGL